MPDLADALTAIVSGHRLSYEAMLRNLRFYLDSGVDKDVLERAILTADDIPYPISPFAFFRAMEAAPEAEACLQRAAQKVILSAEAAPGVEAVIIDLSDEAMETDVDVALPLDPHTAAAVVAASFQCDVYRSFEHSLTRMQARAPDLSDVAALTEVDVQRPGQTIHEALRQLYDIWGYGDDDDVPDFIVALTNAEAIQHRPLPAPPCRGYVVDLGAAEQRVRLDQDWIRIDGWHEDIVQMIVEFERQAADERST